jgi:F0F1-type ATP synthase membrane subunit b/b'
MQQRTEAIAETRKQSDEMIKNARRQVEQEMAGAKAGLQKQAETLADQIIESILRPALAAGER